MIPVYTLVIPDYTVKSAPDHVKIGQKIDSLIKKNFLGKTILVRGIASSDHQDLSVDQLIETIKLSGTDRYDPNRIGDRYENIEGKKIDLFAFKFDVTDSSAMTQDLIWGFYHSALGYHGQPKRIDILLIYDNNQMEMVTHQYAGREDIKNDGFVFKDSTKKLEALKAIFKLTD